MKIIVGDLWDYVAPHHYIGVPVNWSQGRDGNAIMGRGVAQQAVEREPTIPKLLGHIIERVQNPKVVQLSNIPFVMIPIRFKLTELSPVALIRRSIEQIAVWAARVLDPMHGALFLPMLGAGTRGDSSIYVLRIMADILPDSCTLVLRALYVPTRYPTSFRIHEPESAFYNPESTPGE